jgi:hypothetical protein
MCRLTTQKDYVIFWVNGFVMEPSINIPQMSKNATQVLWESALWSSPTDITSGKAPFFWGDDKGGGPSPAGHTHSSRSCWGPKIKPRANERRHTTLQQDGERERERERERVYADMTVFAPLPTPTHPFAGMFGGPNYLTRGLERKSNLPAVTLNQMRRLQVKIDRGEECFPPGGVQKG